MSVQSILQQLNNEISKLTQVRAVLAGLNGPTVKASAGKKRVVSKQARHRMAIAQKARWAKAKRHGQPANQPKRVISIASRRKMAKAQKARWAKIKQAA